MGVIDRRKCLSHIKMDITTWLPLALAVVTFATPVLSAEPRVVCYYTNWSVYRPGTARFNPQNINPYLCTHLVYAFGGFTKDNTLKPFDKYQDIEKGGYAKFTGLKTYNKNLKTMLAIGGWNEGSSRFSPMVASRDRRKEFVRNAIKFLRQNHFDGLDLDWEYPAFRDGGKPKDRENYAKLVRELREEFERESDKTGKPRLLLTMAVPAGIEYIQKGFDIETLNKYLDWMNLLSYDYHSAFEPAVNHHAPLYPLEEPNEYSVDNELNIDYTIKFYLENGADRDKLVLGIPTYGRSYTLFNPDAVEIGSPADGPGEQGDATREKGYLAYYEICEALKPKQKKRSISSDSEEYSDEEEEEEEDEEWTVMHPNPTAMGPVAFKGNQWVGYDDIDIVKKKAEYVAENGLGGIMFWSIDNDDFRGNCHGKPYPLIEAAKESYILKLGSTDNIVASEKPKSRGKSGRRRNRPRSTSTTTTTTTTTEKPSTKSNKRKSGSASTTPAWNIITPEPPTTPDPGSDFKCTDEGFFPHPRDCKKYFWCLDSGPSELGIVAHQFTCPSGLYFNKAADSCDFARNVLCKVTAATTKAPTKAPTTRTTVTTTTTTTTTRKPLRISTRNSLLFRTTSTTPAPQVEEEYEDDEEDNTADDAEDPKVIKELIDLIKKVGGVEQLEKQLGLSETSLSTSSDVATSTPTSFNKKLYQRVLERARGRGKFNTNTITGSQSQNSRSGPQNEGLEPTSDKDRLLKKDRPQYVTINRSRSPSTTENSVESDEVEEEPESEEQQLTRGRSAGVQSKVATTNKPLQYVNIRRSRPTTVSDTADDSASRNALFEREPYVSVSEAVNSLDIASARRENIPEYVTIRRSRPTSETTTAQYQNSETEVESQESALEREITSPSLQPQYTSVLRTRSTTFAPVEEASSPEPTTVLSVQISSFLNSPTPAEIQSSEPLPSISITTQESELPTTTATSPTTTSLPTTPSTTTTSDAPSTTSRRNGLRRRGSTTASTATTSSPTSTTQVPRTNFIRRTKPTAASITTDANTASPDNVETTTNKFTRRGNSRFKSRKDGAEKDVPQIEKPREGDNETDVRTRRPYLNSDRATPRNFAARRRFGGANTSSRPVSSTTAASISRRPFRIASRRRPASTTKLTTTTTTSTQATTNILDSDEYLQDIEEADSIEDPTITTRSGPRKSPKVQRRPLVSLKDENDQNPSATNEDEKKRQSKKYSSTFKQNQLDEALKLKNQDALDVDVDLTTEGKFTESFSAETAVALAAHKLLEAPVPIIPDYEYDVKPTRSGPTRNTQKFKYTTTEYTPEITKTPSYPLSYSTTPSYSTQTQDYIQTSTGVYSGDLLETVLPSTGGYRGSKPAGFTAPTIINPGLSGVSRNLGPSTVRYLSTTEQNTPTQEINPTAGRYTDTSEKYSKSPPSKVLDLTTVYNYSAISYELTPRDKYINTGETETPTGRSRGRRPSTTTTGFEQYTGTSQTLPPTNDFAISKKYSEITRPTTPSTNRYLDDRFTGISEDPFETNKYLDTSDKYTDSYQTPGPSTIDYLDSNRYTGTSQSLNPTTRFTVTGEKYTNVDVNPSTQTYTEDNKYTRVPHEMTSTSGYTGTTDYSEVPINTRIPSRFTNRGESYTTIQNLNPTTTNADTSDRYTSISRRRKPSTTTISDNEKYTTAALQTPTPTVGYTTTNERYTDISRRRRPSTNTYTETEKYTTGTVQNVNPTEEFVSTTEKPIQSRRRRPTTNTNSEQYITETTPTFGFTATSERYTSIPRRTRPSTSRYVDTVTEEATSEFQNAGPTTGFTGINERLTESSPRQRPSTVSYIETAEKSTNTPPVETDAVNNKKYSDISRSRFPSTSVYLDSTEKGPSSSREQLAEDEITTDRYLNPNGQYTGFIQDVNPSTVKYLSTEEKSPDVSPSSVRYPSTTGKYVSGPVDDFGYSTAGYGQSQDPSYFTREYLLASPVTKTYDDEYQYLSPITTTQPTTTTRKLGRKKTVFRRISSTARPSSTTTTTTTTEKPRRVVSRKPFEKIRKVQKVKVLKVPKKEQENQLVEEQPVKEQPPLRVQPVQRVPVKKVELPKPNRVRKPIASYDYYDDSAEKVAQKYEEGTKVILHSKGTIECLDIGNFPHPSSCKKFISCARMESGALLGWEYVCPKGLSFDPVGGICNWSAGLGCHEEDS